MKKQVKFVYPSLIPPTFNVFFGYFHWISNSFIIIDLVPNIKKFQVLLNSIFA